MRTHTLLDVDQNVGNGTSWSGITAGEKGASLFTNLSSTLVQATVCGAGIALLPSYLLAVYDELVHVPVGTGFPIPLTISFTREAGRQDHVRATLNFLRDVVFDARRMPWFSVARPDAQRNMAICL